MKAGRVVFLSTI